MGKVTSKSLHQLVQEQINKSITYNTLSPYGTQTSRSLVQSFISNSVSTSEISTSALVTAVSELLSNALESRIITGLGVYATDPISGYVTVEAGTGTAGGTLFTLDEDTTIPIPFDSTTELFHLYLYYDRITFEKTAKSDRVHLADVIIPKPGKTNLIQDKRTDDSWNAYIMMRKRYNLYGNDYGQFEEDTIELLRDNIGEILADNLIGNIRLSENLKIINTQGTLSIDSSSMIFSDSDGYDLAKFNRTGVHFYNQSGVELSRFTSTDARIGNILIEKDRLKTGNYSSGLYGFQFKDDGNVEINDLLARGTIYASSGEIGGWTIGTDKLYGTTTGTIQTGINVGAGQNGVKLDIDGLHVYDSVLGRVVYLPSDGSTPEFSSGTINNTVFEINTNAVLRTSSTVGDGSSDSYGILINNTGLYGCGNNQTLSNANLKALVDGTIFISGEITSSRGQIGGVTITSDGLTGGTIEGAILRGGIYETSENLPKITIDDTGMAYQLTSNVGTYGLADSGFSGLLYGDGTLYGSGNYAVLFNSNFPAFSILAEANLADLRLYNRTNLPVAGSHVIGDLLVVSGNLAICSNAGSPGTFQYITKSSSNTGGTGSAGSGNQYVELNIGGTVFKVLHDGTL